MSGVENTYIYSDKQVEVTQAVLKVRQKSYSIAGIGSVEVEGGQKGSFLPVVLFGGLTALAALSGASQGWLIGLGVTTFLCIGVIQDRPAKLILRTASGEMQAMKGKRAEVEAVKQAIERAFSLRG